MATVADTRAAALTGARLADYLQLTRPRLSAMALLTVAIGAALASGGAPDWRVLTHALIGAGLVAAGASTLNQVLERESDALMQRTRARPLPSGRVRPGDALVFGLASAAGGVVYLALTLPSPLAAVLAALTLLSYVVVYTPLKRMTALNTLVGAIPGALPPVIGWAAVRGSLGAGAGVLFVLLFLWQMPHFLAIAWIHRADYVSAQNYTTLSYGAARLDIALHSIAFAPRDPTRTTRRDHGRTHRLRNPFSDDRDHRKKSAGPGFRLADAADIKNAFSKRRSRR